MAELSNLPADEMGILPKVPLAMAMVSFVFSSTFWVSMSSCSLIFVSLFTIYLELLLLRDGNWPTFRFVTSQRVFVQSITKIIQFSLQNSQNLNWLFICLYQNVQILVTQERTKFVLANEGRLLLNFSQWALDKVK